MRTFECNNCGATARVIRGDYDFSECGLSRVVLQGIEIIHCDQCDNEDPIILRMNELMRSLALADWDSGECQDGDLPIWLTGWFAANSRVRE